MKAGISLTLRIGAFGERTETVEVPVDEHLMRELMEPVELSDDPWSIAFASPGLYGVPGPDAVTVRKRKFVMRREVAKEIAKAIEQKLVSALGTNDEVDGYKKRDLTDDELRRRGVVR